jgi:rod shape-determining protein MreC
MKPRPARRVIALVVAGSALAAAGWLGWLSPLRSVADYTIFPIAAGFARAGAGAGRFLALVGGVRDLAATNNRLEAEVAALRTRLSQDAELRLENETLRRQLNFNQAGSGQLVAARVVSYQPDNLRQYLTINRGTRDGLKAGQAVVAEGSLVGKISEVSLASAKVFLITDPEFKVGGLDQETRATGTVKGQIGSGVVMDKIAQSDQVKPGDTIITSGLGGEFPKGIIIGRVESVNTQGNAVFQSAQIASGLRLPKLEVVFVETGQ